jgi:hypothetical protein
MDLRDDLAARLEVEVGHHNTFPVSACLRERGAHGHDPAMEPARTAAVALVVTFRKGLHESAEAFHVCWQAAELDLVVDPEESDGREAEAPTGPLSAKACGNDHTVAAKGFHAKLQQANRLARGAAGSWDELPARGQAADSLDQ